MCLWLSPSTGTWQLIAGLGAVSEPLELPCDSGHLSMDATPMRYLS